MTATATATALVACDVADCQEEGTVFPGVERCPTCGGYEGDTEGIEAPEGWGIVVASDSSGEHQHHVVCKAHNEKLWALLGGFADGATVKSVVDRQGVEPLANSVLDVVIDALDAPADDALALTHLREEIIDLILDFLKPAEGSTS